MTTPAAIVRCATETDLPALCALLDRYYTEWDIWNRDPASAILAQLRQPDPGFFLAESENQPAGCVLCRALPSFRDAVECKRLFVAPEFRGRNIATQLMEAVERSARDAGQRWIYLDSKAEFTKAIELYRSRGYTDCPRYNNNAQATIFLRKSLSPGVEQRCILQPEHTMAATFPPSRLEAFSDGVIAVIITIMVLDLKVPRESGIMGLRAVAPVMGVYALSFTFVGIYWVNHHLLIHRIHQASPRILWANLIWLFCLSLLPFFTAYVLEKREDSFSVAFYAGSLFLTGLGFMLLRLAVSARQLAEGSLERTDNSLQIKHWGSLGTYLLAIPLAYLYPLLSLVLIGAVTAMWIIPTLGVEHHDRYAADLADSRPALPPGKSPRI